MFCEDDENARYVAGRTSKLQNPQAGRTSQNALAGRTSTHPKRASRPHLPPLSLPLSFPPQALVQTPGYSTVLYRTGGTRTGTVPVPLDVAEVHKHVRRTSILGYSESGHVRIPN